MRLARPSTLFTLTFLGMELSYLYILVSLLGGPIYALSLMLLLYPLALLSRITLRSTLPHRLRFSLELALIAVVILLVAGERLLGSLATGQIDAPGIILRMGLCGLIWWLGYSAPHKQVNYSTVAFRLQIGVLAVLVFSQVKGSAPPVLLFFLLAPPALFLARWASSFSRGASALRSPDPGYLLLAGASVTVPGTALVLSLSPGVARAIVAWLGNAFLGLSDWLDAQQKSAASPPAGFNFNFSCSIRPEQAAPPPTPVLSPSGGATGISPAVIWIIAFFIFLAIVTLIALALRKRRAGSKSQPVEAPSFQVRMVSLNMLRSLVFLFPRLLKRLWRWLISLFRKWRRRPDPPEEALISIRALYRNLLRWADKQGIARAPWQTPLEHLELLEHKFPQQQDGLKQVTEAYLLARYSRKPVSQEEFDRAREAWRRAMAYPTR